MKKILLFLKHTETDLPRFRHSWIQKLAPYAAASEYANSTGGKQSFKLPRLELRKFTGEPKKYLAFWSQFSKIHIDDTIADEDKFQYLLQSVVSKSKAARLVESYPPTGENYPKVNIQLKERFGRDDLLVQIYTYEDLLSLVMKNASGRGKTDLAELYDLLESKLMALESLGRTKEKYADFLEPIVESCVLGKGAAPSTNLPSAQLGAPQRILPDHRNEEPSLPTNAALMNAGKEEGSAKFKCIFCSKPNHVSSERFLAQKMSLADRKSILMGKKRLALNVLKKNIQPTFAIIK